MTSDDPQDIAAEVARSEAQELAFHEDEAKRDADAAAQAAEASQAPAAPADKPAKAPAAPRAPKGSPAKKAAARKTTARKAPAKKAAPPAPKPDADGKSFSEYPEGEGKPAEEAEAPADPKQLMLTDALPAEMGDLLDAVADYAEQVEGAGEIEDKNTLSVGRALTKLYENRAWVAIWNQVKPTRQATTADSQNRFAAWLTWAEAQRKRKAPDRSRTYRLIAAVPLASEASPTGDNPPTTEGQVRPLNWLRKNGFADSVAKVWDSAVQAAKTRGAETASPADVETAVVAFRKAIPKELRAATKRAVSATSKRDRAEKAVRALFDTKGKDEILKFDTWYQTYRKTQSKQPKS